MIWAKIYPFTTLTKAGPDKQPYVLDAFMNQNKLGRDFSKAATE